jgi:hypothetical protein
LGAEDFAARAAGLPPWALSAAFQWSSSLGRRHC